MKRGDTLDGFQPIGPTLLAGVRQGNVNAIEYDVAGNDGAKRRYPPLAKTGSRQQVANGWTLYDLRKLRFERLGPTDPEMDRLIHGYDLVIVARNAYGNVFAYLGCIETQVS